MHVHSVRCLTELREHGPATLGELAQRTKLSRPTVDAALGILIDLGLVEESAPVKLGQGAGRPARRYRFMSDYGLVVGVDVGSHSVRAVVADLSGRILASADSPDSPGADGVARLTAVCAAVRQAIEQSGMPGRPIIAMGVGVSGIVGADGRLAVSSTFPDWVGVDIAGKLGREFDTSVVVENDMNLAALAERRMGAAQLADDFLYVFIGHRISTALILAGEIRQGSHSAAGEIDASSFDIDLDEAGEIRWHSAAGAAEVFRAARDGDPAALAEVAAFAEALAKTLATVSLVIDPDAIVLGGGLSRAGELLLSPLRDALRRRIRIPALPRVIGSVLSVDAVALGALSRAFGVASSILSGGDLFGEPTIAGPFGHRDELDLTAV